MVGVETKIYTFLHTLKLVELKRILSCYNRQTSGRLALLRVRVMLTLYVSASRGKDMLTALRSNRNVPLHSLEEFLRAADTRGASSVSWVAPLSIDEMMGMLGPREKRKFEREHHQAPEAVQRLHTINTSALRVPVVPELCLNEYARLLVMLRDDKIVKLALMRATPESRSIGGCVAYGHEHFWAVVEQRFNDPAVEPLLDMRGRMDEVRAYLRPLAYRNAETLKDAFARGRKSFMYYLNDWERIGRNERELERASIPRQDERDEVRSYLAAQSFERILHPGGELSAGGKRAYVTFSVCRIGSRHEDTTMLNLVAKTLPGDMTGSEDGIAERGRVVGGKRTLSISSCTSTPKRKRRNYKDGTDFERWKFGTATQETSQYSGDCKRQDKETFSTESQISDSRRRFQMLYVKKELKERHKACSKLQMEASLPMYLGKEMGIRDKQWAQDVDLTVSVILDMLRVHCEQMVDVLRTYKCDNRWMIDMADLQIMALNHYDRVRRLYKDAEESGDAKVLQTLEILLDSERNEYHKQTDKNKLDIKARTS